MPTYDTGYVLKYSFPIADLTIGGLLAHNRLARFLIPKELARTRQHLLAMAEARHDLADADRARSVVIAEE